LAIAPMQGGEEVFVREVNEELQRDQLISLWQRFGKPVVWGIVALLALWGGWIYWQHRQNQAFGLEGETFHAVIEGLTKGTDAGAEAKLQEMLKSDAKGFVGPAGLVLGGVQLQAAQAAKAAESFGKVAANGTVAQPWKDIGLLRQTAAEFDTLKPEVAIARLKPLAVAGNPWFGSAGEMTAMAYLKMNKPDLAGKMFAAVAKDEKVPLTIRNRSSEMANSLGVESARPAPKEGQQ
jgi:hypothetical protein